MSRTSKILALIALLSLLGALAFAAVVRAQEAPQITDPNYWPAKAYVLQLELQQAVTYTNKLLKENADLKAKLKVYEDEK